MWQSKAGWVGLVAICCSCSTTRSATTIAQPVVTTNSPQANEPNVRELFMRLYSDDELSDVRIENAELDPSTPVNPTSARSYCRARVEKHSGNQIQILVRTDDVRYRLWVPSTSVARFVTRSIEVFDPVAGAEPSGHVTLGAGASVEILEDKGDTVRVRHLAGVEFDTRVPAAALTLTATMSNANNLVGHPVLVRRGALIYQQPDPASAAIAKVSSAWQLGVLRELDKGWLEVRYTTSTLDVVGYYSPQMPPSHVNSTWTGQLAIVAANGGDTELPKFTCLYSSVNGAIAGIVDKTLATTVEASTDPHWKLASIETPWGLIRFALHAADPKTGRPWATCDE
jgi:hypothetical protein